MQISWRRGSLPDRASMSSVYTWFMLIHSNVYFNLWQTPLHWVRKKSWSHTWEEFGKSEYVLPGCVSGSAWPVAAADDAGHSGRAPGLSRAACAAASTALSLPAAWFVACMGCVGKTCQRAEVWLYLTPKWDVITEKVALTCGYPCAAGMALLLQSLFIFIPQQNQSTLPIVLK